MSSPLPPPLAPMQRRLSETQPAADVTSYEIKSALTLGLGGEDSKTRRHYHQAVSQEEHMETGIGVHQDQDDDDDDDVLSSAFRPPQLASSSGKTTAPAPAPAGRSSTKRTSLIERSREFREKLVYFMKDCDDEDEDYQDHQMEKVDLEGSNRFPTRAVDLRHVDQGVNLMDASSARLEWREDEEAREIRFSKDDEQDPQGGEEGGDAAYDQYDPEGGGDDQYYENEGGGDDYNYEYDDYCDDDSDVYAGYTQGYSETPTGKEEEPPIAGCGGLKMAMDHDECDVVKMEKRLSTMNKYRGRSMLASCDWSWGMIFLMISIAAVCFLSLDMFRGGHSKNNDYAISASNSNQAALPPPQIPAEPAVEPAMPANADHLAPGMGHSKGDVSRRKHVLDHIVEEELIKGSHSAVLNPSHPSAKKAITWMTTYDPKSMKLLDEFDFHPPDEQSDKLRKGEDIDAPSNHATKIIDRYVEVVYYFESNTQATPETAKFP